MQQVCNKKRIEMKTLFAVAIVGMVGMMSVASAATLDDVKQRGMLNCGVNSGLAGFAASDKDGNWTGFDVDFCRAVAAAIFDDAGAVAFTPLSTTDRFKALQSGDVDVLARNTTWNMSREVTLGLAFGFVNYYDGQGFMVRRADGFTSALDLSGATVCVLGGTTTESNLVNYFETNKMQLIPAVHDTTEAALAAYDAGDCDAYTGDSSALYANRLTLAEPDDNVVLPEIISKEPLGPAVRQGDDQWLNIVKWVGFALLNAEELGVTQENVDAMRSSDDPEIRLLLDTNGTLGKAMGLDSNWVVQVVKAVGNYGEIFRRNVGVDSPLQIARGLNALWTRGGIQYAPPVH
jgi:general L-amino acid transport system substrate-binding protein